MSTVCVACGGEDYGDPPDVSGGQVTWSILPSVSPETIVVVVDDTSAAASLREKLTSGFDGLDAARAAERGDCGAAFDPAAWHSVDRSVVIVHPSSQGAARFSSPASDPSLRWREHNRSAPGHASWMTAVRGALVSHSAEPGASFQALAAFRDSASLLVGLRQPKDTDEQALLDALPGGNRSGIFSVALATEDQSPGPADQYTDLEPDDVVVPAATPGLSSACERPLESPTPRYAGWGRPPQLWPCDEPRFFDTSSLEPSVTCASRCLSRPLLTTDSGATACRVTATYPGNEPCPAELGWLEPLDADGVRRARVEHDASGDKRVCEIRQLEDAALASCRERLDCTGCEPGWCATEVSDLIPTRQICPTGTQYMPFRFVLGAGAGPDTVSGFELTFVCDESTAQ